LRSPDKISKEKKDSVWSSHMKKTQSKFASSNLASEVLFSDKKNANSNIMEIAKAAIASTPMAHSDKKSSLHL
jgi:glyceraldehyde-3-phosphate dehydrogenase/erythrose-4-phosphate dehydrogenase